MRRPRRRFRGPWRPMLENLLLQGPCRIEPYVQVGEFRAKLKG